MDNSRLRWIGIDLDGTLAEILPGRSYGPNDIGKPVPAMAERVRSWLSEGKTVKIFTARACWGPVAIAAIEEWTRTHFGQTLEVTNVKDPGMVELYDDRAWRVEFNTGRIIGGS